MMSYHNVILKCHNCRVPLGFNVIAIDGQSCLYSVLPCDCQSQPEKPPMPAQFALRCHECGERIKIKSSAHTGAEDDSGGSILIYSLLPCDCQSTPDPAIAWVCRCASDCCSNYMVFWDSEKPTFLCGRWQGDDYSSFALDQWHAISAIRLNPGEGPLRLPVASD